MLHNVSIYTIHGSYGKGSATIFFSLRGEDQEDEPFAELLMEESLRWQSTIAGVQVKMTFLAEHVNSQVLEKNSKYFLKNWGTIGFPSQFGMILPFTILGPMLVSLRGATRCHAKSWPLGFAKFGGLADVQSPVAWWFCCDLMGIDPSFNRDLTWFNHIQPSFMGIGIIGLNDGWLVII